MRDQFIHCGIPIRIIDTIENTEVAIAFIVEIHGHAFAHLGSAGFAGVVGADGVDHIGIVNAALEIIHIAMIFKFTRCEVAPLQAGMLIMAGRIFALVANIVNGEQAGRAAQNGIVPVPNFEIGGCERGLPIVGVDDVGFEANIFAELQASPRKKGKAARIIQIVIEITVVINPITREIFI